MFKNTLIALAIAVAGSSFAYAYTDNVYDPGKNDFETSPSMLVAKQVEKITKEQEEIESQGAVERLDDRKTSYVTVEKKVDFLQPESEGVDSGSSIEDIIKVRNQGGPFLSLNYKISVIKTSTSEVILKLNANLKPNSEAEFTETNRLSPALPKMVFDGGQEQAQASKQLLSEYGFIIGNKTSLYGVVDTYIRYEFAVAEDIPPVVQSKNGKEGVQIASESRGHFNQRNAYSKEKNSFARPISEYHVGNYIIQVDMSAD